MKVLFLTDGIFPFQLGGMQKHSLMLSRLLLKKGIHLRIVHCGGEGYTREAFFELFDPTLRDQLEETFVKFPKTDPFPGHYIRENKAYSKNAFLEMEDKIDEFDLIYAQGFSGWRFIKEKHKKQIDLPIFVNFHGLEMYQTAPNLRVMAEYSLFKNAVKWNMRNADYVYSFGGKLDEVIGMLGVNLDRVLIQSNGIEKSWLADSPTPNNVVRKFIFIGRDERRKGIEELNKALELMLGASIEFEFTFIGPISEKKRLNNPRIHYLGEIRNMERIKEVLRSQDCLVCPSHAEGMPTVILEAMACGLAVVGTDVGAVARQIKSNGVLLEKPDVVLLKRALERIIEITDENLTEFKQKSLELIESQFLWERVAEQKMEDFRTCLSAESLKEAQP